MTEPTITIAKNQRQERRRINPHAVAVASQDMTGTKIHLVAFDKLYTVELDWMTALSLVDAIRQSRQQQSDSERSVIDAMDARFGVKRPEF